MKIFHSCTLAILLMAPVGLRAATFEGKVSFKITPAKGAPQDMVYAIKGDKLRIEMPAEARGGMGGIIVDTTNHQMLILMDAQRMYMVQSMADAAAPASGGNSDGGATMEKSGQKEKILGYDAEKYVVTATDGSTTELWLAEGLGTFVPFAGAGPMGGRRGGMRGGAAAPQGWERVLAGKELFPLRVVTHQKSGGDTRMEVTSIEKQSLADSLFSPPADYQKFDMGGMMKGLMPGGMRPGR